MAQPLEASWRHSRHRVDIPVKSSQSDDKSRGGVARGSSKPRRRVELPAKPPQPAHASRGRNARGSSQSQAKTSEKNRSQKPLSLEEEIAAFDEKHLDDELALAEMTSFEEEVDRVKVASLASLSSEAFRAGVSPPLDPAFVADEKFLSENSNESDASIVEISSDSDSDASSTEDSDDEDDEDQPPSKKEILSDESTSEDFEYFRGELNLFEEDIAGVFRDLGSIRIAAFGIGEADKPDDALCAPYRAGKVTLRRYGEVCDRVEALLSCYPWVKVTTEKDV
ncbi:hypothetical protein FAUST_10005 [Fusarium austroamericanum]|uniref:Uncharacterized protein n=1 Tax=Fusarium austroamericanum TaxID=282268 RepID=A0AAN6BVN8_FUSAU|nr:hypothetical protein FAUST_10005 [Fusarium austroamericanum]